MACDIETESNDRFLLFLILLCSVIYTPRMSIPFPTTKPPNQDDDIFSFFSFCLFFFLNLHSCLLVYINMWLCTANVRVILSHYYHIRQRYISSLFFSFRFIPRLFCWFFSAWPTVGFISWPDSSNMPIESKWWYSVDRDKPEMSMCVIEVEHK